MEGAGSPSHQGKRPDRNFILNSSSLRSLVITNSDAALASSEALRPPSSDLDVRLGKLPVRHKQPEAKDRLGEDVEDSVCNNLGIDTRASSAIGNAPDTVTFISMLLKENFTL